MTFFRAGKMRGGIPPPKYTLPVTITFKAILPASGGYIPNPEKPDRIATKTQTLTVYYNLTSCLGALVAKMFF